MPVQVYFDPQCGPKFVSENQDKFQQWVNANHQFTLEDGTALEFDQAYVLQVRFYHDGEFSLAKPFQQ